MKILKSSSATIDVKFYLTFITGEYTIIPETGNTYICYGNTDTLDHFIIYIKTCSTILYSRSL